MGSGVGVAESSVVGGRDRRGAAVGEWSMTVTERTERRDVGTWGW